MIDYPTADDVALAIVLSAREYKEDPIEVARGMCQRGSRELAYCVLTLCFPMVPTKAIVRMVGGAPNFLTTFRKGWKKEGRNKAYSLQQKIAQAVTEQFEARKPKWRCPPGQPFKLVDELHTRKQAVPVDRCENVNRDVLGDPQPGRSALDAKGNERRI